MKLTLDEICEGLIGVGLEVETKDGTRQVVCGVESQAMLCSERELLISDEHNGIPDLRAFFEADLRWLRHYGFKALQVPTLAGGLS